jgi:hypothetical protein
LVEARRSATQAELKTEAMKKRVVELLRIKNYHEKLVEYLQDGGDINHFRPDEVLEGEAQFRVDSDSKKNQTRIALLNDGMSQMRFEKKAEAVASLEKRLEENTLANEDLRRTRFQMGIDLDETFGKASHQEKVSEHAMERIQ